MHTTIDAAGRVVVPKRIRDEVGLRAGQEIEISAREGRVVIEPVGRRIRMVEERGVLVADSDEEIPALTAEQVREVLERTRR